MSKRPSNKEKINKISEALEAVRSGSCAMSSPSKHLVADLAELEIEDEEEYWTAIETALEEISQADRVAAYAGHHPPEKSYEIPDAELWAYRWNSRYFGKEMYIKFAMKKNRYLHVDCHENRRKK